LCPTNKIIDEHFEELLKKFREDDFKLLSTLSSGKA
jgi:hypothetical protein